MNPDPATDGQPLDTDGRLTRVRLLLLDVDGVLTDGRIVYDDRGVEIKAFHVRDGLGLKLLMAAGVRVGVVTGRRSAALDRRLAELNVTAVWDGVGDKAALLGDICGDGGVSPSQVAFVGDDLPDIPIMRKVGLAIAVADAHRSVRETAHWVLRARGGRGAVREVCEAILTAQRLWEKTAKRFGWDGR